MWKPTLKRRWVRSSLRERLNEYVSKKENEEGIQDYIGRQRVKAPFFLSLLKSLHSYLLLKVTLMVLIVLMTSLLAGWHHPLSLKVTDGIHYVTTWNMDVRQVRQEVVPVMRSLWEGSLEESVVQDLPGEEITGDWQQEIEKAGLFMPVEGEMAAGFGMRLHPLWGREEMHYGVDLAAAPGSEVVAPLNGKTMKVEGHPYFQQVIYIDHGEEWVTVYGHIDDIKVSPGQIVEKGQIIGTVRESPPGGEPRLHFEVRHQGQPVDPYSLIKDNR